MASKNLKFLFVAASLCGVGHLAAVPIGQCGNTHAGGSIPRNPCDTRTPDTSSGQGSRIDNLTFNHLHDATDYMTQSGDFANPGCSTCGMSKATASPAMPSDRVLQIKRIQSLRESFRPSSFGTGVYLTYDVTLNLFDVNGVTYVDCFDPENWYTARRFSPSGSIFLDTIYNGIKSFTLYTAAGAATTSRANAVRGVLVMRNGEMKKFELFPIDANTTGGRLVGTADSVGTPLLSFTYEAAAGDPSASPEQKWRKATASDFQQNTLTFANTTLANGSTVISGITLPNGSTLAYQYDDGGNLTRVDYPNGDTSTFERSIEDGYLKIRFAEAGAQGTHRNKTAYYTNNIAASLTATQTDRPQVYNQSSWLVQQVKNGSAEIAYEGIFNPTDSIQRKVYEGVGRLKLTGSAFVKTYASWNATTPIGLSSTFASIPGTNEAHGWAAPTGDYDKNRSGTPAQVTNPDGTVHTYRYDASFNMLSETIGTKSTWRASDTRFNKPLVDVDFSGKAVLTSYDAFGNPVSRKSGWVREVTTTAGQQVPGVACFSGTTVVDSQPTFNGISGANTYTATLTVDTSGSRTFYVSSRYYRTTLYIDGKLILNPYYNQGERAAAVNLTAGTHEVRVLLDGSGYDLAWSGPETKVNGIATKIAIDSRYLSHLSSVGEPVLRPTAAASEETWEYFAPGDPLAGLMKSHTDGAGKRTEYAYDANRRLVTVKETGDSGSLVTLQTLTYDAAGNRTSATDAVGRTIGYAYDTRNRLIKTSYGDNTTETVLYGTGVNANLVVQAKDRSGSITKTDYDTAGRPVTITRGYALADNDGNITQTLPTPSVETNEYLGGTPDVTKRTLDGKVTEYAYDYKGRVIATTSHPSDGKLLVSGTKFSKDEVPFTTTDAHGCRSFFAYRAMDKKLVRTVRELVPGSLGTLADNAAVLAVSRDLSANPGYAITDYTLDNEGRTIAEIDQRGVTTSIAYDAKGRVSTKTFAAGTANAQTVSMTYDAADRVLAQTDALNRVTSRTYTPAGRVASVVYPDSTHEDFTYYADGKLASRKDADGFTSNLTWSQCCGREFGAANPKGEGSLKFYDGPGRVTYQVLVKDVAAASGFVNWTGGGISFPTEAVVSAQTMKYDARGRLVASTKWNSVPSAVDPHNPPIASAGSTAGFTTTYAYFDDLSDSRLAPALSQLAAQGKTLTAGSAVIVTNPAGEQSFSITDGAGRSVASGTFN